ncbi:hypothetical protein BH10PSE13_BH10PSE13_16710 [soil metagenome]
MSIAAAQIPLKVGILFDIVLPSGGVWDFKKDIIDAMRLTFEEGVEAGLLDRPVEIIFRECEGLPRGSVKEVIDTARKLVEEDGCIIVFGPLVTENAPALREYIEQEGRVTFLSMCGSDDWLGEWTFALGNGSMPDEPFVIASIIAQNGHKRVACTGERSLIGQGYMDFFRKACEVEGLAITGVQEIAQTDQDAGAIMTTLKEGNPDAIVHWGFGFGAMRINAALDALGWSPPRYMGTSWEDGFLKSDIQEAFAGWVGLEQYDEENPITQAFLDRFEARYGHRPPYFTPGLGYDLANAIRHALANAHPLSPQGVKLGMERVKMLPAASGSAGTRVSFGKWTRRGWMGASYLVAREFDAQDPAKTIFRGRIASR